MAPRLAGLTASIYLVLLNAALLVAPWPVANGLAMVGAVLAAVVATRQLQLPAPELMRRELVILGSMSMLVAAYALSWYWRRVPYDFWIDFPQQSLLYHNGLDITHPFFAGLALGGQYGRNLMVAGLAHFTGLDLITVCILSTVIVQTLLVLQIYALFREHSERAAYAATLVLFMGLGVGGWCGFLDHFFHHAALAHFLLFVAWQLVQHRSGWMAGPILALGLVYPLFVCLLAAVWLLTRRPTRNTFLLVLPLLIMLPLQGGPLRQLLNQKDTLDVTTASQHQEFSVTFPKKNLFCIDVQAWRYWRVSLGLSTSGALAPIAEYQPVGYSSIFSLTVLQLHWLPLWLAPLSLLLAPPEGRRWFLFGAIAYLTPGVVDFGPVYEAEYYRWELAAAIGFAGCLALSLPKNRWAWLIVALCCWPGVYRLSTMAWTIRWPSETAWFSYHRKELRLRRGEVEVLEWLSQHSAPDDLLWRDALPDPDDTRSMNGDASAVGLTGLRMTGRSFPLPEDYIGRPPFRPTLNARAFWILKDPAAVTSEGVRWLVANSEQDYSLAADLAFQRGEVSLWEVRPPSPGATPKNDGTAPTPPPKLLRMGTNEVRLEAGWCPPFEGVLETVWTLEHNGSTWRSEPVFQSRHDGLILCAPVRAGAYNLRMSTGQTIPVLVSAGSSLRQARLLACRHNANKTVTVVLKNEGPGELRLHDAKFSLLPVAADGGLLPPLSTHTRQIFKLASRATIRLTLPAVSAIPSPGALSIESREESGLLELP